MSVSAAGTLLLLVGVLAGYAAEEHVLDWTVEGVDKYREDPLEVKFGDVLTLNCHPTNISNFVYVESREQYDSCNASATDGKVLKSGDCLGNFSDAKSFSQNIQRLSGPGQAVVEYQAGKLFYFYSSANGSLASGNPPYVGGQCLEGLKMIIYVVDESAIPSTTTLPRLSPTVTLNRPGGTGKGSGGGVLSIAHGILTGFAIVIVVLVVIVNLALCAWCVRKKSKTRKEIISSMESADSKDDEIKKERKMGEDKKMKQATKEKAGSSENTTAAARQGGPSKASKKRVDELTNPLLIGAESNDGKKKMGGGGKVQKKQTTTSEKAGASTKPGAATGATGQGGDSKVSKKKRDEMTNPLPTLPSKTPAARIGKNSNRVSYTNNEDQKSTGKDGRKGSVVDNGKKERTGAATGDKQPSQVNGGGRKEKVNGATATTNLPKSSNGREASKSTPKSNNTNKTPNNTPKNNTRKPAPPPPVDAAKRSAARSSSSDPATTATGSGRRSSLPGTGQSPTKSNSTGPNRNK